MPPRLAAAAADPGPRPRLLLATAHPDDEALFFVPALLGVGRGGGPLADVAVVDVVCLSTGA
jgi:LmbE family N-acetylglucosaminyl deacetylase